MKLLFLSLHKITIHSGYLKFPKFLERKVHESSVDLGSLFQEVV